MIHSLRSFLTGLLAVLATGTACGQNNDNMNPKALVIFFSHAGENYSVGNIEVGNTKIVADYISESLALLSLKSWPKKTTICPTWNSSRSPRTKQKPENCRLTKAMWTWPLMMSSSSKVPDHLLAEPELLEDGVRDFVFIELVT